MDMNQEMKQDIFKAIMGSYPTGVTIITTVDPDHNKPVGITVNSFSSVSLDPTFVLFCVDLRSSTIAAFQKAQKFAVHVLAEEQKELCFHFASKAADKFSTVDYEVLRGLPILSHTLGVMECMTVNEIEAGDHIIFIGEVQYIEKADKDPLMFFRRKAAGIPRDWAQ